MVTTMQMTARVRVRPRQPAAGNILCVMIGIIVSLCGTSGYAQTAGGDGRALDANQSGQGGRANSDKRRFLLNEINNAIVTGNVAGGKGFRGDLGYSAARDFRGEAGSNDLFGLTAGSYLPGLVYQRSNFLQVGTNRGTGNYGSRSLFQPTLILNRPTTGAPLRTGNYSRIQRRGIDSDPTGSLGMVGQPYRLERSVSDPKDLRRLMFGLRGSRRTPYGTTVESGFGSAGRDSLSESLSGGSAARVLRSDLFGIVGRSNESLRISGRGLPSNSFLRGTPAEQRLKAEAGRENSDGLSRLRVGDDPYADLLAKMISQANSIAWTPGEGAYSDRMIEAIRRFNRKYQEMGTGSESASPGGEDGGLSVENASDTTMETGELVIPDFQQLRQMKKPTIAELAGETKSVVGEWMQRGEVALGKGLYFDAERAFIEALGVVPDYPYALAGRAHAQLGAGLYRSASRSIRALILKHPELVVFEYAPSLKPTPERLAEILAGVRLKHGGRTIPDAGLLTAYVGRLMGNDEVVREGLRQMKAERSNDSIRALLERAWLDTLGAGATSDDPRK